MLPFCLAVLLGALGSAEKIVKLVVVLSELRNTHARPCLGTNLLVWGGTGRVMKGGLAGIITLLMEARLP
jgi:hypothetical protein